MVQRSKLGLDVSHLFRCMIPIRSKRVLIMVVGSHGLIIDRVGLGVWSLGESFLFRSTTIG